MGYGVISGQIPTPASIGAAPTVHTHDASAVVSGIIPAIRGGTGFNNLEALANAIGAVKIETGSYIGTGNNGPGSPNQLTFNFQPQVILIAGEVNQTSLVSIAIFIRGFGYAPTIAGGTTNAEGNILGYTPVVVWNENTVTWNTTVSKSSGYYQSNESGVTYNYVALG